MNIEKLWIPLFQNKIIAVFLLLFLANTDMPWATEPEPGERKEFSRFSAVLPAEWDGDEQTGFISDNPDEYMLTLTRKDEKGDKIEAQVSVYMLPNKPGKNSLESARALAEAQGESTEPVPDGNFIVFEGEPRSNTVKGRAITMVNATPDTLLIIISQDPQGEEGKQILESLRGTTDEARRMLGR